MKKSYPKETTNDNSINNPILIIGMDTLLYIPAKLFPALFGFIGLTIYTRVFSPEEFGIYSLITATIGIIGVFAFSWINQSNLRFFQSYNNSHKLDIFLSTSFFLLFITLIVSSIILFTLSRLSFLPLSIIKYLFLILGVLFTTSLFETVLTILMSDRKPKMYSIFRSFSVMLNLVISLLFIYILDYRVSAILIGYILTNSILFLIINNKLQLYKYISLSKFSTETLKEFMSYGVPLLAALVLSWILTLSDRYLIEYFRSSYEVGLYSASYQLADYPIALISSTIIMGAFPIILDTWEKQGDQATIELISNIMKYYIIFAIPALLYIIILSQEFMIILGNSYSDGHIVLPWICFGSLMLGLCVYVNKGLELKKKTKILSLIVSFAAISNILLNFFLIPQYGFYGAGVATGVAYLIYFITSTIVSKKYLKCKIPVKSTINSLFSSLIMGISLLLVRGYLNESIFNLVLVTSLGIGVYIVCLLLSGELKDEFSFTKMYLNSIIDNL